MCDKQKYTFMKPKSELIKTRVSEDREARCWWKGAVEVFDGGDRDRPAAHIKRYQENIILNVLSATDDIPICEPIKMSRLVDNTGQRRFAVVTKSDQYPDELLEKLTSNNLECENLNFLKLSLGCHLSMIDKLMVGMPVSAQKLVEIQSVIISKCLLDIVKKINDRLNVLDYELNKSNLTSIPDELFRSLDP
ncbi:dynamin central domain-containing protein [Artemisia annua]|uniref:Dynamin central domain-containing protein n=1 Tax=Artemisia annua TaxID=35608 RepID=A0A2U1PDZ0_ARTAN|nr:dynamin central domain-containing protein [Artemisia annua]